MSSFNQLAPSVPTILNTSNCFIFSNSSSGNALSVQQLGAGNVASFRTTTGATALFINPAGNVGVGTTNPATALDVYTGRMNAAAVSATTMYGALAGSNTISGTTITGTTTLGQGAAATLSISDNATKSLQIILNTSPGAYNSMVSTGDTLFTTGTLVGDSSASSMAFGPWSSSALGMKVSGTSNVIGLYSNATTFYSNASATVMTLTNGRVGVGVASPLAPLHTVFANSGIPDTTGSGTSNVATRFQVGSVALDMGNIVNGSMWLQNHLITNWATNFKLLLNPNGGSVGIGTTDPGSPLQINCGDAYVQGISFSSSAVGAVSAADFMIQRGPSSCTVGSGAAWNASNCMIFHTPNEGVATTGPVGYMFMSSTSRIGMFYDTRNSRLGIGTTSPSDTLHVYGGMRIDNGATGDPALAFTNTSSLRGRIAYSYAGLYMYYQNDTQDKMRFYNGAGGAVVLQPTAGNVGIGITNPSYPLHVVGQAYTTDTIYVGTTNTDPTFNRVNGLNVRSDGRLFSRNGLGHSFGIDSTSGTQIQFWTDNGSSRVACGAITSSGSSTSYSGTSDYRLKENIQPITTAMDVIARLRPVTYTWKADGTPGQGFIAHELQEVIPECVVGEKDAIDSEGNIKPQGVDKTYIISYIVASVQELSAENTALKTQMSSLEQRLATLEAKLNSQ